MKQKGICMKRIIYIVTACAFLSVSTAKAQQVLTLKECLEEGLQNNYSLRIVHNEEQISKNNATLGNAGYFPTLDFSAGYTGNLENVILLVFILLYTNKIAVIAPCKRNRIETKSVF